MKKLELLAPAGSQECLEAAVLYGADAVYLGGKQFGLRMGADNFSLDAMEKAVEFAHSWGVKVYVTVNIFAHNRDIRSLPRYLKFLDYIKVDGILVSDLGVFSLARREVPNLPIHISTQANITNREAAAFWEHRGAERLVMARELSLWEIREIAGAVSIELEAFVHGAMCMSYSGRCLLSNMLTGRSANQGDCSQPCRWKYALEEEKRPGEYFPVFEDEQGSYILNSKDLCLLEHLPELALAGVTSFKIEGRAKGVHYVATVVKVFRQALDLLAQGSSKYQVKPEWWEELSKVSNRDYTIGFVYGGDPAMNQTRVNKIYRRPCTFVGKVLGYDAANHLVKVEQRNNFRVGQTLEVISPTYSKTWEWTINQMYDENKNSIEVAPHPCQIVWLPSEAPLPAYTLLRRKD